jgi:hypothetical protein
MDEVNNSLIVISNATFHSFLFLESRVMKGARFEVMSDKSHVAAICREVL